MRKIVDRVVSGARAEVRRCQLQKQERMGNNCHKNEKRATTQQLCNVPTSGSSLKKVLSRLKTTKERKEGKFL